MVEGRRVQASSETIELPQISGEILLELWPDMCQQLLGQQLLGHQLFLEFVKLQLFLCPNIVRL